METLHRIQRTRTPSGSATMSKPQNGNPACRYFLRSMPVVCLLFILSGCESRYYIRTNVHKDLSLTRSVYADSSDFTGNKVRFPAVSFTNPGSAGFSYLSKPFSVDFYDEQAEMNMQLSSRFDRIQQAGIVPVDTIQQGNPLFDPQETLKKKFRWFYTCYEYSAVYRQIPDLPVPLDEFLDPEQQTVFFRNGSVPPGWNGRELYENLDEINRQFVKWYNRSVFEVNYSLMADMAAPPFRERLQKNKAGLYGQFDPNEPGDTDNLADFCQKTDAFLNTDYFSGLYTEKKTQIDSLFESRTRILSYFNYSFIHRVDLPGKLTAGNALHIQDGDPVWKIDGYRLLSGDLHIKAVSRTPNIWAFILTFLLLTGMLYVILRKTGR